MEPQIKEEMKQFFGEFWENPENVERFKVGADKRAESANCRLSRGNVALMSGYVATESEFEKRCGELRMPVPEFVVATD